MGMSRSEDIMQAIIDGTDSSTLASPQSRSEYLLIQILNKINSMSGGGGGGAGGLAIHICTEGEYDATTRIPTILYPSETTFYLVPSSTNQNDMYDEWVYVDNRWEMFGSGASASVSSFAALSDVSLSDIADGQTIVYDASTGKWKNVALRSFCFEEESADVEVIIDAGSIDDD